MHIFQKVSKYPRTCYNNIYERLHWGSICLSAHRSPLLVCQNFWKFAQATNFLLFWIPLYTTSLHWQSITQVQVINKGFEQLNHNQVTFYDLSEAVDCVPHDILDNKLYFYGFENVRIRLPRSYLGNREHYVSFKCCKSDDQSNITRHSVQFWVQFSPIFV